MYLTIRSIDRVHGNAFFDHQSSSHRGEQMKLPTRFQGYVNQNPIRASSIGGILLINQHNRIGSLVRLAHSIDRNGLISGYEWKHMCLDCDDCIRLAESFRSGVLWRFRIMVCEINGAQTTNWWVVLNCSDAIFIIFMLCISHNVQLRNNIPMVCELYACMDWKLLQYAENHLNFGRVQFAYSMRPLVVQHFETVYLYAWTTMKLLYLVSVLQLEFVEL